MSGGLLEALSRDGRDAFQTPEQRRHELARDLVAAAYLRGSFVLSSGQHSTFYFDKYLFVTKPTVLRRLASLLAELVPDNVDRIAGPELGAVPLASALSLETGLPFVIVRQHVKTYATGTSIEGELHAGESVLLLEDVLTTASQALRAAGSVTDAGATVTRVLAVVDREQGGREAVNAAGYPFTALFRLGELPVDES